MLSAWPLRSRDSAVVFQLRLRQVAQQALERQNAPPALERRQRLHSARETRVPPGHQPREHRNRRTKLKIALVNIKARSSFAVGLFA